MTFFLSSRSQKYSISTKEGDGVFMNQYTLTWIGEKIAEDMLFRWWEMFDEGQGQKDILNVNPDFFQSVLYYLSKQKYHVS